MNRNTALPTATETAATVLLRERAVRQTLVDSLQRESLWVKLIGRMVVPAGFAVLLYALGTRFPDGPDVSLAVAAVAIGVFWLITEVSLVNRRMQLLTSVLAANGALAAFVDGAGRAGAFAAAAARQPTDSAEGTQP